MICFRCKKPLDPPVQPISPFFRVIAAFSLAPLHGGAWAWEEFSKEYCSRCRVRLSVTAVVMALLMLTIGIAVFRWVVSKGLSPFR